MLHTLYWGPGTLIRLAGQNEAHNLPTLPWPGRGEELSFPSPSIFVV